jgi:hypothetical protein
MKTTQDDPMLDALTAQRKTPGDAEKLVQVSLYKLRNYPTLRRPGGRFQARP